MAEPPPNLHLTLNKLGWVPRKLDRYCTEFVELSNQMPGPIADIGCAYGYTTKALLESGATVLANDLSEQHLQELAKSIPSSLSHRLTLLPGDVTKLTFENDSFGGILAARIIHFLPAGAIRPMIRSAFNWLKPGGIFCVTCHTMTLVATKEAKEEYLRKKKGGNEWPGTLTSSSLRPEVKNDLPEQFYAMDEDVLTREVELAGFIVDSCEVYGAVHLGNQWMDDICVGVIARKPCTAA